MTDRTYLKVFHEARRTNVGHPTAITAPPNCQNSTDVFAGSSLRRRRRVERRLQ